ncbi:Tatd related dnase, partial [Globisporangium splendens]
MAVVTRIAHSTTQQLRKMATAGSALTMIDIGANLTDPVFTGSYRGKQRHQVLWLSESYLAYRALDSCGYAAGGSLTESRAALALARRSSSSSPTSQQPALYSTVGVHPTRCSEFERNEDGFDAESYFAQLVQMCEDGMRDGKVVAVGECGLDYDRLEFCDKATQLKYFDKQFELAERTKLPMFLHNRNTGGDFYGNKLLCCVYLRVTLVDSRFSNGVVHSFTGPTEEALKLVELGLYIGINGCSLKTAENLETVRAIPTERLMIETGTEPHIVVQLHLFTQFCTNSFVILLPLLDAPWCDIRATHAGFSHVKTSWQTKKAEKYEDGYLVKGRNEPCTIIQVLEIVSAVRGEDQEELAKKIYENTCRVFFPTITAEDKHI